MINKIYFKFILNAKKGFKKLVGQKKIFLIRKIIFFLHQPRILKNNEKLYNVKKELIIKQFLVQKLLYQKFAYFFLYFYNKNKEIIYPLPLNWIKDLKKNKQKINLRHSLLLFYLFNLFNFINGIIFLVVICLKIFLFKIGLIKKNYRDFIMFNNLNTSHILHENTRLEFTLLNWLKKNNKNSYHKIFIDKTNNKFSSKDYCIEKNFYDPFIGQISLLKFFFNLTKFIFEFFSLDNLKFNFILFKENIELIFFKSMKKIYVKEIYFIWTNNIFRPLWTYEVEKKGCKVIVFFNGHINEIRTDKSLKFSYDWEGLSLMTWSNYFFWEKQSVNFMKQRNKFNFNSEIIGPVYLRDKILTTKIPAKSIAVFGYENHKKNLSISTIGDYEHYNEKFLEIFYFNIYSFLKENNYYMILKRKNNLGDIEIKKNKTLFEKLYKSNYVIKIDADVSPFQIIKRVAGVISMPFTSTSSIANYLNVKNVYYDPFDWVQKNDPAACGLNIISDLKNIKKWLKN